MLRTPAFIFVCGLMACAGDPPDSFGGSSPSYGFTPTGSSSHALEVSGGTVQILGNGLYAAVVDADGARVALVDLTALKVRSFVTLPPGSAPGRMAIDDSGDLYVALRATGEVARVLFSTGQLASIRAVCGDPRGLAWDKKAKLMRVACADGKLAAMPPVGPVTTQQVQTDLRDVLVSPAGLSVTTFRTAQVRDIDTGITTGLPTETVSGTGAIAFPAGVAWHSIVAPDGSFVVAHQRAAVGPVEAVKSSLPPTGSSMQATGGAYSTPTPLCTAPVVRSTVTVLPTATATTGVRSVALGGVLPVDLAVSPDGKTIAVALYGSDFVERVPFDAAVPLDLCVPEPTPSAIPVALPDGVAFTPNGKLVIHSSNPSMITLVATDDSTTSVVLDKTPLTDVGQTFFHTPVNGVACASCHPEGRDDAHVWNVAGKPRRTPSLAGGLLETAPFHWQGELNDMDAVVQETFVNRMGGTLPDTSTITALGAWMEGIAKPASTSTLNPKLFAKAKAMFESSELGCTSCHSGVTLTSNATIDVGTGGEFQVPSLRGVGARAPYLHDGRAATLADRFTAIGGAHHGNTAQLTSWDIELLTGYLETL